MKKLRSKLCILSAILIMLFSVNVTAQQIPMNEDQIRRELEARGIDEDIMRAHLLSNGINPDSIQYASPEELLVIQSLVEQMDQEEKTFEQDSIISPKAVSPLNYQRTESIRIKDSLPDSPSIDYKLYGHEYFDQSLNQLTPPLLINESYVLGSGDVISVSIWSRDAQFDRSFIVNNNGYVRLSDASQRIFVRGMSLADAREKIRSRFRQFYRFGAGEFSMTLESVRNINISVFGEVIQPGAISFSAAFNVIDAIRMVGGMTENGSVRNIRIINPQGEIVHFDLYKYLEDPGEIPKLFMEDGAIIHVPVYQRTVKLTGAVRRPSIYEIHENEGLLRIIALGGGFEEDAIKTLIQIERFEGDLKTIYDVDLIDLQEKNMDFNLNNGDVITIKSIEEDAKNYVVVQGEVINPGRYQRVESMRISEILDKAGLKDESKTDFAFLKRKQLDGTSTYFRLNIDKIIEDPSIDNNLELFNLDTLTIWAKKRFVDDGTFSVEGAIRIPGEYKYDYSQQLYFSDALLLAGGLSRDASKIAFIHRSDPLKPNEKQYIRVNLDQLDSSKVYHENLLLQPFDRIEILSKNLFTERTSVEISGPVNNPGTFQYGEKMTLKDLVILAGGFKMGASTQNIEVSRVLIKENKPTQITIAKVEASKDFLSRDDQSETFLLEPYDHVKVRYVAEFEFQKDVEISGEVKYPGIYTLASKNEKIADIIRKAGGLTEEAFVDGATLFRQEDSIGYIVLNLENAIQEKDSRYNYILKDGDLIEIPKIKDFVSIRGATKANEIYGEKLLKNPKGINVPYHESKSAGFYIRKYTGGLADNASKQEIFVEHPNGEIEKTRNFLFFTIYPEVRKGSVIKVGVRPKVVEENQGDKKEVDWSKVISDSLAQAMTIFTLILLAKQATN